MLASTERRKPKCLFIGALKGQDTPTRERFDAVYSKIVAPASELLGMEPSTAVADGPGMITTHIFREIRHAHAIVADLTGDNFCVGYELAFAHMMGRCTALLVRGSGKLPHDVKDMNRISYDPDDPKSMANAKRELADHLRKCEQAGWASASNPIFLAAFAPPEIQPPADSFLNSECSKAMGIYGYGPPLP